MTYNFIVREAQRKPEAMGDRAMYQAMEISHYNGTEVSYSWGIVDTTTDEIILDGMGQEVAEDGAAVLNSAS